MAVAPYTVLYLVSLSIWQHLVLIIMSVWTYNAKKKHLVDWQKFGSSAFSNFSLKEVKHNCTLRILKNEYCFTMFTMLKVLAMQLLVWGYVWHCLWEVLSLFQREWVPFCEQILMFGNWSQNGSFRKPIADKLILEKPKILASWTAKAKRHTVCGPLFSYLTSCMTDWSIMQSIP